MIIYNRLTLSGLIMTLLTSSDNLFFTDDFSIFAILLVPEFCRAFLLLYGSELDSKMTRKAFLAVVTPFCYQIKTVIRLSVFSKQWK